MKAKTLDKWSKFFDEKLDMKFITNRIKMSNNGAGKSSTLEQLLKAFERSSDTVDTELPNPVFDEEMSKIKHEPNISEPRPSEETFCS